jgi:hypothetical protein
LIGKLVPFLKERDPLIHKVWSGLIGRLKDDKYYIVQEAFNSLSIICKVSPEFVAKRISDDVIPKILVIFSNLEADLNSSRGTSGVKDLISLSLGHQSAYSKRFATILHALESIKELLGPIAINFKDTKLLSLSLVKFLDKEYPKQITDWAVSVLMTLLAKNNGDIVYFELWKSCSAKNVTPFQSSLQRLSIPCCMIVDNVKYLIHASSALGCSLSIDWKEEALLGGMWQKI